MQQKPTELTLEQAQTQLLIKILDKKTYDNITFLSLMSLFFKPLDRDFEVQQFELEFLHQNDYCIKSLNDLQNIIANCNQENKKKHQTAKDKWLIFQQISRSLSEISNTFDTLSANQQQEQITNATKIINELLNNNPPANDNDNSQQQMFDIGEVKTFSLSPTKGIAMLNKNPYQFYVEKVLKCDIPDNWNEKVDARIYGTIIHEILDLFAKRCKDKTIDKINQDLFYEVADGILTKYNLSMGSFLKAKIDIISTIAIKLEKDAKQHNREVITERSFSHNFNGVIVKAVADRIEIDHTNNLIYIFDYKTGTAPTASDELEGKKTQLTIIALLMLQEGNYDDYAIAKDGLYYISFSGKSNTKTREYIDTNIIFNGVHNDKKNFKSIEENLKELLQEYFDSTGQINTENCKKYVDINDFSAYEDDLKIKQFMRNDYFV